MPKMPEASVSASGEQVPSGSSTGRPHTLALFTASPSGFTTRPPTWPPYSLSPGSTFGVATVPPLGTRSGTAWLRSSTQVRSGPRHFGSSGRSESDVPPTQHTVYRPGRTLAL